MHSSTRLIAYLSLSFFSSFYQNSTEELLLKCNLRINFIIRRNLYIFKNYAFIITWNYNPFCFIIIVSMINSNNFTRKFLFSRFCPQKINILFSPISS